MVISSFLLTVEFDGMEAGYRLRFVLMAAFTLVTLPASTLSAANYRTQNFLIQAPDGQLARAVGNAAEKYRAELATHWLGKQLPPWPRPCPIRVISGQLAAQGVTTYSLEPVRDFQMEVVGTPERILDSVLPHEITHTILATHFGRPLPRWADEGICTTVEHVSERSKHEAKLREFLRTRRGIAMNQLFLLTEYPNDVLPMYAQGYSVCRFLIEQKGAPTFINFLQDYMDQRSWTQNVKKHYGYNSLRQLQEYWLAWVADGSGPVERFAMVDPNRAPVRQAGGITADNSRLALAGATNRIQAVVSPETIAKPARAIAPDNTQAVPGGALATALDTAAPATKGVPADMGWYTRQRDEAKNTLASQSKDRPMVAAKNTIRPIAPPSILQSGRYSVSQPQEEQQMSRSIAAPPYPADSNSARSHSVGPPAAQRPSYLIVPGQTIRRFR